MTGHDMSRPNLSRLGDLASAFFAGNRTAGMEHAARRRGQRRGNLALERARRARSFDGRIGDRRRVEQRLGVGMRGMRIKLVAVGDPEDIPMDTWRRVVETNLLSVARSISTFLPSMLERGVYLPPSQFEACFVSAAHTKADLDKTIRACHASLKEL